MLSGALVDLLNEARVKAVSSCARQRPSVPRTRTLRMHGEGVAKRAPALPRAVVQRVRVGDV